VGADIATDVFWTARC